MICRISTIKQCLLAVASLAFLCACGPALAQQANTPTGGGLTLELNVLQPTETGCRAGFLAENPSGAAVENLAVESVLFNADNLIERLLVLEFGYLSAAGSKVRLFELDGLACANLSRILFNDVVACEGTGLDPRQCMAAITLRNRTAIEFGR